MNVIVLDYSGHSEQVANCVTDLGHTVFFAQSAMHVIGILHNQSLILERSFGAIVTDIKIKGWTCPPFQGWQGLFLLGYLEQKGINIPTLVHSEVTSFEGVNFQNLPAQFPFVTFAEKNEELDYISPFLTVAEEKQNA